MHAEELLEARRLLRAAGIEAELHRARRQPRPDIERIAVEHDYDTIVVGTRGLSAIARTLQGSVSDHVATHARTTVVIARWTRAQPTRTHIRLGGSPS